MARLRIRWDDDRAAAEAARMIRGYDPVELALRLERLVQRGTERKYFRFRGSRFYGGSAVGDVVGCNLRCVFCWTGRPRDDPRVGFFVDAPEAARRLLGIARREKHRVLRLSAGEPTVGFDHLLALLDSLARRVRGEVFVLETNGIILGYDYSKARRLAEYSDILHVRVSLKACNESWFTLLTGAAGEYWRLQLRALENLKKTGVSFHFSIFAAYGSAECWGNVLRLISDRVGEELLDKMEVEALVLYPTVERRLKAFRSLFDLVPRPDMVYR